MFPIFAGANPSATGYNLTRSLRFRRSATAYLSRTNGASPTSNQIWTISAWIKRGALSVDTHLLGAGQTSGTNYFVIDFPVGDTINIYEGNPSPVNFQLYSTQVFRDPSAWYHIVLAADTTQATAANRLKLYVNGSQVTSFTTANYPTQNSNLLYNQNGYVKGLGNSVYNGAWGSSNYDGQIAEHYFIDGQALTPSSFGSTNALTGVWQPAPYTGSYGTNGFILDFEDNSALTTSSNVGLGKDTSGNGNYWTTNNISITAGVTYDSMTDVPTLTSATAANFAVLNPINKGTNQTLTNGNLTNTASGHGTVLTTIGVTSGLWYGESTLSVTGAGGIGFTTNQAAESSYAEIAGKWWCYDNGTNFVIINQTSSVSYATRFSAGQVWQWALNVTTGKLWIGVNNAWLNSTNGTTGDPAAGTNPTFTFTAGTLIWPILENAGAPTWNANFGQRPFTYTAPTGFVALNTYNLPDSTIVKGNTVMDVTLYTGTGASLSVTNAASFKPDFVWVKSRSAATSNKLTDSVRGVTKGLISNTTGAETTDTQGLTAFGSAGFTVGTNTDYNNSAATYVGWQWQAGQGSTSSNTNGSITSTVSVNASAGFSVVTYTGTAVAGTIGHGLGVAPQLIIVKPRTGTVTTDAWNVYHVSIGNTQFLALNATDAATTATNRWNSTSPTSSVFSIGTVPSSVSVGYVAYCWTPIAGFSAFGSYTGNGSTNGPFVYTGFRPKFVLIKWSSGVENWAIIDTSRATYNAVINQLFANTSGAENTDANQAVDILSNGFKLRGSLDLFNNSGGTYIYAAYAENPLKNALAR